MTELVEQINAMLKSSERDLEQIERTLTDGYAHALTLEAEKWRLEKRIAEVAHGIQRGDTQRKARELADLSKRRDGNDGDLVALRSLLGELRKHAEGVRIGSPVR
ncbi:MAG TPA: hypothetical protein VI408_03730 [Gaiellaceae bacterium]